MGRSDGPRGDGWRWLPGGEAWRGVRAWGLRFARQARSCGRRKRAWGAPPCGPRSWHPSPVGWRELRQICRDRSRPQRGVWHGTRRRHEPPERPLSLRALSRLICGLRGREPSTRFGAKRCSPAGLRELPAQPVFLLPLRCFRDPGASPFINFSTRCAERKRAGPGSVRPRPARPRFAAVGCTWQPGPNAREHRS